MFVFVPPGRFIRLQILHLLLLHVAYTHSNVLNRPKVCQPLRFLFLQPHLPPNSGTEAKNVSEPHTHIAEYTHSWKYPGPSKN